jgi:hypothetical protein
MKVSLVAWYIGGVLGWLMMALVKGVAGRSGWSDPVFIVYSLIALTVITLALDGTMLIVVRGDALHVIGILRRTKLRRDSCRFVVERIGSGKGLSHAVLLTDDQRQRQISYYWMWGDILAYRAVARLERNLLEN